MREIAPRGESRVDKAIKLTTNIWTPIAVRTLMRQLPLALPAIGSAPLYMLRRIIDVQDGKRLIKVVIDTPIGKNALPELAHIYYFRKCKKTKEWITAGFISAQGVFFEEEKK